MDHVEPSGLELKIQRFKHQETEYKRRASETSDPCLKGRWEKHAAESAKLAKDAERRKAILDIKQEKQPQTRKEGRRIRVGKRQEG